MIVRAGIVLATMAPAIAYAASEPIQVTILKGIMFGVLVTIVAAVYRYRKRKIDEESGVASSKYPLARAAANGELRELVYLIDGGTDVNQQDSGGGTALMYAVRNNQLGAVELLLQRGAAPHLTTPNGKTAADIAKQYGFPGALDAIEGVK